MPFSGVMVEKRKYPKNTLKNFETQQLCFRFSDARVRNWRRLCDAFSAGHPSKGEKSGARSEKGGFGIRRNRGRGKPVSPAVQPDLALLPPNGSRKLQKGKGQNPGNAQMQKADAAQEGHPQGKGGEKTSTRKHGRNCS